MTKLAAVLDSLGFNERGAKAHEARDRLGISRQALAVLRRGGHAARNGGDARPFPSPLPASLQSVLENLSEKDMQLALRAIIQDSLAFVEGWTNERQTAAWSAVQSIGRARRGAAPGGRPVPD